MLSISYMKTPTSLICNRVLLSEFHLAHVSFLFFNGIRESAICNGTNSAHAEKAIRGLPSVGFSLFCARFIFLVIYSPKFFSAV